MPPQPTRPAPHTAHPPAATPDDDLRRAVRSLLDDFTRRVRQSRSDAEVDAHRDELTEVLVGLLRSVHAA